MLTTGLDILRILAEAEAPLTATAIAERVGIHVSNVSRTLGVLARHGYVRKPTYHSFAPDLGILALAGASAGRMPAVARTGSVIAALARTCGMQATLAALHRGQVLYLHRCQSGGEGVSAVAGGWPLHLSVVGLRLLLDQPVKEARAALELAAKRYGWERPTPATPEDPATCLAEARRRMRDGILRIDGWGRLGYVAAATTVRIEGQPLLAIALDGASTADPTPHLASGLTDITNALTEQP